MATPPRQPEGAVCSFCGQRRTGGVSGQGTPTGAHICPACIRLTHALVHNEDDPPEGD